LVLALVGCFVDKGGATTVDLDTSVSASSSSATGVTTGGTGGSGVTTTTEASATLSMSGDASTMGASTSGVSTTVASGGTDVTGSTGGECQALALLAMTDACVKGTDIASEAWGTQRCEEEFGEGWSWLEHHHQGGWDVEGMWIEEASVGLRGWIQITNQSSECFSNPGGLGLTWVRQACVATCHPGCDPYDGDTTCDQCLRLICVGAA
jgi:hypothetical protein